MKESNDMHECCINNSCINRNSVVSKPSYSVKAITFDGGSILLENGKKYYIIRKSNLNLESEDLADQHVEIGKFVYYPEFDCFNVESGKEIVVLCIDNVMVVKEVFEVGEVNISTNSNNVRIADLEGNEVSLVGNMAVTSDTANLDDRYEVSFTGGNVEETETEENIEKDLVEDYFAHLLPNYEVEQFPLLSNKASYLVVLGNNVNDLESKVNEKLSEGYYCMGGISTNVSKIYDPFHGDSYDFLFAQAMILPGGMTLL